MTKNSISRKMILFELEYSGMISSLFYDLKVTPYEFLFPKSMLFFFTHTIFKNLNRCHPFS